MCLIVPMTDPRQSRSSRSWWVSRQRWRRASIALALLCPLATVRVLCGSSSVYRELQSSIWSRTSSSFSSHRVRRVDRGEGGRRRWRSGCGRDGLALRLHHKHSRAHYRWIAIVKAVHCSEHAHHRLCIVVDVVGEVVEAEMALKPKAAGLQLARRLHCGRGMAQYRSRIFCCA